LWWEKYYFDGNTGIDPNDDAHGDSLTNLEEYGHGTNPVLIDTDNDWLLDDWELGNGLDPLDDGSLKPANGRAGDPDDDGLTNELEWWTSADPQE